MRFHRTPDERFENLADYPFAPNYLELVDGGLRLHYVDEGPREGGVVLLLHGEPSWSYLYRSMIPVCAAAGQRVIAPDLIGFGRSDKPSRVADYSFARHVGWLAAFLQSLDLREVTLFCQDWGSLIGLRLVAEEGERFGRVIVGNGGLPTGDETMPRAFKVWQAFARFSPWFPVARIVDKGCRRDLDAAERAAYDAPFPSSRYLAGARAFPRLVPTTPTDPAAAANRSAWRVLERWEKPFLTLFSTGDPITRGGERVLQARIPGCAGQPHGKVRGGHFLQEDAGPDLAERIVELIRRTS